MKAKFATFIIPFIFFNNPLLAQDYCSSPQKYYDVILTEVANKNPNAYIVYNFWGNTQSASGQTPWIPVKCIMENSVPHYPVINLDNRELNLFFLINENMKKAKKIKLRLEN